MSLLQTMKGVWNRMTNGSPKQLKTVFEVSGVPSFSQFYFYGIFLWKFLYKGFYKPWHVIPAPTIMSPNGVRNMETLCAAKAISSELASLIWAEECDTNVSTAGREKTDASPDPLREFVNSVLEYNNFNTKTRELIEQAMALGGGAFKVWYDTEKEQIQIGYHQADQFVPLSWNNATVSEGVFISRQAKDGYYYTTLEFHKWNGQEYVITNELYRAQVDKSTEPQDILGIRVPLSTIYSNLEERTVIGGLQTSLFSYFRTNIANNLDDNSPLGVSIYANALSTLKALDICYDSFIREFVLGKKRIIVPAQAMRYVTDPTTGARLRYFDANDEVYEALSSDDDGSLNIKDNSVELRVEEHEQAINAFLGILAFQIGLSPGSITFDKVEGLKTATEVISEKSKTFKTVKLHQKPIKAAVEKLIHNIIAVAILYDVHHEGQSVESLASAGYDINVFFDDSIVDSREAKINEGVLLINNGLMSKIRFMMEKLGYTEDDAKAELQAIKDEGAVSGINVDELRFNQFS